MTVCFTPTALKDYENLSKKDKNIIRRINRLIESIDKEGPLKGIGKPEILRYVDGYSRRIDSQNRLVYRVNKKKITIISCIGHYEK
ncbi:MAG: Txe/YoeB family addiction module toxin [Bacilli bacterium]|nr:Txe/YoeB family addiction module toxin [Bacilli bacterium]